MSFLKKIPLVNRLFEQKALVGDAVNSLFNRGVAKHPRNLSTYKKYYDEDSTVGIAIDILADMVVGVGHYLTVDDEKNQEAVNICKELEERIRADEKLLNVEKCRLIYGFCPVERVTNRGPPGGILNLQVLDSQTVTYKRDSKGKLEGFRQEITGEKPVDFKPDELIWFVHNEVGNAKGVLYGTSKIARVLDLLQIRDQVIDNINKIMENQAKPRGVWKVMGKNDVPTLKELLNQCVKDGTDPILYPKDSIDYQPVIVDPRTANWEYVPYIDTLIVEGLHAPMLEHLRNATQASADSMLESIQRWVEGEQRYMKRMWEHEVLEWHLRKKGWDGEVPKVNWGSMKTGVEDLDVASIVVKGLETGKIDRPQYLDLLKQLGLTLLDPEPEPEEPELPPPQQEPPFPPQDPELIALNKEEKKSKIAAYKRIAESSQPATARTPT